MTSPWPNVRLGEVLKYHKQFVTIDDLTTYKRPRVQLHARGVVLRDAVPGALIKTKKQQLCRAGEFLVAEIDAKVGGFGLVPEALDGAIVSSHYFLFAINETRLDHRFLDCFIRTRAFRDQVEAQGSTNYAAIRPTDVLGYVVPVPPLAEQRRIVARIGEFATRIEETRRMQEAIALDLERMLTAGFRKLTRDARRVRMSEAAPLVRRPVEVDLLSSYPELGIRSFGRGTFHKPALSGSAIGGKRIYGIEPGDLLFSNVFAWEGAIAVARPEDTGRVGSHRFITCVPKPDMASATFLRFFFLTDEGLDLVRSASPGGAGRNRTLGLSALAAIRVPLPSVQGQLWFDALQDRADTMRQLQAGGAAELKALVPATLDRAFKGEL